MTEAEQERARVVAWLFDEAKDAGNHLLLFNAAMRIERGEHIKEN